MRRALWLRGVTLLALLSTVAYADEVQAGVRLDDTSGFGQRKRNRA